MPLVRHLKGNGYNSTRPLISGRTYEYRIAAYYSRQDGDFIYRYKSPHSESARLTAPTVPAPTDLTVTTRQDGLHVEWSAPPNADNVSPTLTGYILVRSSVQNDDGRFENGSVIAASKIAIDDPATTSFHDDSTLNTKRYSYQVIAVYEFIHSRALGNGFDFILGVGDPPVSNTEVR